MKTTIAHYWKSYKGLIAAAAALAVLYLCLFAVGITCPIKYVTGISCPGCGMSRACFSAVRGEFADAFAYHPLWVALPVAIPLLAVLKLKRPRAFTPTLIACALVMIAVWLYRLIAMDTPVVVFAPTEGLIGRLLGVLFGG